MKSKLLSFFKITFLLSTILLVLNSCTKDNNYENWYNDTNLIVDEFTILEGDWLKEPSDQTFYYDFYNYGSISDLVMQNGAVSAVAIIDGTNRPLPYTTYFINEAGQYCAETVSFEYNKGYIRFNIASFDLFENSPVKFNPSKFKFEVTVISQKR